MNRYRAREILAALKNIQDSEGTISESLINYFDVLKLVFDEIASKENVQLGSLFAQMAFVGNKYQVNKQVLFHLHDFRKFIQDRVSNEEEEGCT